MRKEESSVTAGSWQRGAPGWLTLAGLVVAVLQVASVSFPLILFVLWVRTTAIAGLGRQRRDASG